MDSNMISATLLVEASSSVRAIISSSSRVLRIFGLIAAAIITSTVCLAQADFEKGYQAFQSYHGSDFDTVNLANGNLVLNIPLLSYEQRGNIPPVTISIRSNSTTFQSTPQLLSGPKDTNQHEVASGVIGAPWGQPHVLISPGGLFWKEERIVTTTKSAIGPEYLVRFVAIDDSGATHSLGGGIANSAAAYVPGIRYSVDGSGLMLQAGTTTSKALLVDRKGNTGGMVDPSGNAIRLNGPCATTPGSGEFFDASLPSWENYAHGTASATSITDSIGRAIPNPSYLPTVESYSCLVDVDASYHAATLDASNVCPQIPSNGNLTITQNAPINSAYYVDTFSFPGDGTNGKITLKFCYAQIAVSGSIPQVNGADLKPETINETWWVLTSVQLPNPDTPTYWQFGYDKLGQIDQVIMPTGAMVTYKYAWRLACGNPPGQVPVVGTPVWPYSNILSSPMVTNRNVYLSSTNSSPIEQWSYSNGIGSGWIGAPSSQSSSEITYPGIPNSAGILSPGGPNSGAVTVKDPLGNITLHTFSLIGGSTCGPWETKTQYYQGASQLLKEVNTAYSYTGTDYANPTNFSNYIAVGVFPKTVTTTLSTNSSALVSTDIYLYDTFGSYEDYIGTTHPFSFGQVLASTESDFGSAAPSRSTLHTKLWQSNWNYYSKNLIDLPCLDTVLSGSIGSTSSNPQPGCTATFSNQIAQTAYKYDERNGSPQGFYGHQTSVTRWLNGGTSPRTQSVYNSNGMPVQKIDANGNATTLTYDASGLYLKQIQYPDLTSEYPTYDDNTGLLMSNKDQNGQTTSYTYDTMRRLKSVSYPDNGSETLSYVDAIGSLSVSFTKAITATTSLAKEAFADGLGRLTQTQMLSDPYGTVYTDTTYDSLGRVASVSNPYRSKSEATYGITKYTYDTLSRKAIVTAPDGTQKQACFNGISTVGQTNCLSSLAGTLVAWEDDADENMNDWQRSQNALGQMTHVFEPDGTSHSPSMRTDYSYDLLNNLLSVNQWGGAQGTSGARGSRTFTYDSLSRLIQSYNPETGWVCYGTTGGSPASSTNCALNTGYDPNGNLLAKTDARGVTTAFVYDTMNRLLSKAYSGDASTTPWSCYQYSESAASCPQGSGNRIGRLTNAWTQSASSGTCAAPSSGPLTKRSILCYDPMGRITSELQYTMANITSGTPYAPTYSYDLAGDLVTSTNGIGPKTVGTQTGTPFIFTNTFDAAGRLQSLASNWTTNYINGTANVFPATLFNAQTGIATCPTSSSPEAAYAAFGGLQNAAFGIPANATTGALTVNRSYDIRLRTTCETSSGNAVANSTPGTATVVITGSEQSIK